MEYMEEVLSLDLEDSNYLYRIRRGHQIVYILIHSRILARLHNLPVWNNQWNTLMPHRLSQLPIHPSEYYNFLDLPRVRRISNRISFIRLHMNVYVLKITRFGHEISALHTEIKAYSILERYGFRYALKFLGYIYEEIKDRIAKLIDFEAATFRDSKEYLKLEQEEVSSLAQKLANTSIVGDYGI
ncbi:hypothetical protein F5882DRAFT_414540 [Hyaloscypha sp. PMI_1271]|nr:hypothetical protein F5882DRAFT_414540 [Hyaloscypha sp. PMI_1271]